MKYLKFSNFMSSKFDLLCVIYLGLVQEEMLPQMMKSSTPHPQLKVDQITHNIRINNMKFPYLEVLFTLLHNMFRSAN
jgi:hypothetical protein